MQQGNCPRVRGSGGWRGLIPAIAIAILSACGVDEEKKPGEDMPTVPPSSDQPATGVVQDGGSGEVLKTNPADIDLTLEMLVDEEVPYRFPLKLVDQGERQLILMPADPAFVNLPVTQKDSVSLDIMLALAERHARTDAKAFIGIELDTYFQEAGSTEYTRESIPLIDVSAFKWEKTEGGGYGAILPLRFDRQIADYNEAVGKVQPIKMQLLTILLADQASGEADTLILSFPILVQ